MQYKIPVQIENEDPILLGLSLKQIIIIVIGLGIAYMMFGSLSKSIGPEVAAIPSIMVAVLAVFIAVFKYSEMGFIHFVLAFIQYKINESVRYWVKGVDSFSFFEIGYLISDDKKIDKVDFGDKMNKMKTIDEKLDKI